MTELPNIAFLDFEASSLGKHGYPIEVAWVFANGQEESHLIRPAPTWTDWDAGAEAVHGIPRGRLMAEGAPLENVAQRIIAVLTGATLYATAPSWDGKWLSKLLRAAGLPRHALRLQDTDMAHRRVLRDVLKAGNVPADLQRELMRDILAQAQHWSMSLVRLRTGRLQMLSASSVFGWTSANAPWRLHRGLATDKADRFERIAMRSIGRRSRR
jgi:hypothetical protein